MAVEGAPPERKWAPTKSEALANMKNKVYVKDGKKSDWKRGLLTTRRGYDA